MRCDITFALHTARCSASAGFCRAYYTNQSRTAASPDDFWTDATAIRDYLAHVETLTARVNTINTLAYNADPAILGWDLINEGRCDGGASCSAAQIQVRRTNQLACTGLCMMHQSSAVLARQRVTLADCLLAHN